MKNAAPSEKPYIPVSVIIPVFNAGKYIAACLQSLLSQKLEEIQIICVDDGSTDNTREILARFAETDDRITIMYADHAGAGAARNAGIEVARGEYLFFCDADDICHRELLFVLYNNAKNCSSDVVVCGSCNFTENKNKPKSLFNINYRLRALPQPFSPGKGIVEIPADFQNVPWNKLFRREFVLEQGLRFQSLPRANDVFFSNMTLFCARNISVVNRPLYYHRRGHGSNLQANNADTPLVFLDAWRAVRSELEKRNMAERFGDALISAVFRDCLYYLKTVKNADALRLLYLTIRSQVLDEFGMTKTRCRKILALRNRLTLANIRKHTDIGDFCLAQMHDGINWAAPVFKVLENVSGTSRSHRVNRLKKRYVAFADFLFLAQRDGVKTALHWSVDALRILGKKKKKALQQKINCAKRKVEKEICAVLRNLKRDRLHRILLVSHELTYTGACISLLQIAILLQKNGFVPIVWSRKDGALRREFEKAGIKVKVALLKRTFEILGAAASCDLALVNSMVLYRYYRLLSKIIPTLWFVREPAAKLREQPEMQKVLSEAANVFAMSPYSREELLPCNPNVEVIKHGLEDHYAGKGISSGKVKFCIVGTMQKRKGQDILLRAVEALSPSVADKTEFHIVGRPLDEKFFACLQDAAKGMGNVLFHDEISNPDDMLSFYEEMSAVIVPSRNEPTSRVVIEAMMMGRPAIVSDRVGAKYLVGEGRSGFVYPWNDYEKLAEAITCLVGCRAELEEMGRAARQAYLENNSIAVFERNLLAAVRGIAGMHHNGTFGKIDIDAVLAKPIVPCDGDEPMSVVIPVYNALEFVKNCLTSLLASGLSDDTEILIMDDCSDEETGTWLRSFAETDSRIVYFRNQENLGFVGNCNAGIAKARNNLVVLLNSDTRIPEKFEQRIKRCFRSDSNIAIASPIATNSALFSIARDSRVNLKDLDDEVQRRSKHRYPFFTPEGFCFALRKNLTGDQMFFDPVYGAGYKEEEDLVLRTLFNGHKTVLIDDMIVEHIRTASFKPRSKRMQLLRNNNIFFKRWGRQRDVIRKKYGIMRLVKQLNAKYGKIAKLRQLFLLAVMSVWW